MAHFKKHAVAGVAIAFVGAFCLLFGPAIADAEYSFHVLGGLPTSFYSVSPTSVSGDGSKVVGYGFDTSGATVGFTWSSDSDVGLLRGTPTAISPDGKTIVGGDYRGASGQPEAFRLTDDAGYLALGNLSGGFGSNGYAVSADGNVVVGVGANSINNRQAISWSSATGVVAIGQFSGKPETWGMGVSADGQTIVGYASTPGTASDEAFVWTSKTGMIGLGFLGTAHDTSYANAVSSDGTIVVGSSWNGSAQQAFRWTAQSGMVPLIGLPGDSRAFSVSADGSVAVGYGNREAMLWTEQLGMVGVQEYLMAHGVTGLDGLFLYGSSAVSADGTTIVGTAYNSQGEQVGWIAKVPEPPTAPLSLVALGAFIMLRACRLRFLWRSSWHVR